MCPRQQLLCALNIFVQLYINFLIRSICETLPLMAFYASSDSVPQLNFLDVVDALIAQDEGGKLPQGAPRHYTQENERLSVRMEVVCSIDRCYGHFTLVSLKP